MLMLYSCFFFPLSTVMQRFLIIKEVTKFCYFCLFVFIQSRSGLKKKGGGLKYRKLKGFSEV